jgi:acetyl esterase/lipase
MEVRPTRPNLLVRSLLTSVSFLLIAIPAIVVFGGSVPQAHVIAGFGRLLNPDLPWLAAGAVAALVLALGAVRLGGARFTRILALVCAVVLVALAIVGGQFAALAAAHGATYDVLRQARAQAPIDRAADETLAYAEVDGGTLHAGIWRPAAATAGADSAGLRTGVLFFHGGGFTTGWLGARPYLFAALADRGLVVVDVEYRLAPPPRWKDAPGDGLCALGWLQVKARELGIDPARIAVMGDSAGGNLALMAAYAPGSATGPASSCEFEPAPPAAVVAVHPVADLAGAWTDLKQLFDDTPFPEVYTGGTPAEVPDRYEKGSVAHLVRAGLPPTLLLTGVNDALVTVGRVRALADAIRQAGSEVELVEVPFADHGFDSPPNGFGAQLEEQLVPAFLSARFLGNR